MADEQGPIFGFGFEGDDDSARREADRMTKIIGDALGDAFKKIGPQMGRQIARALSEGNKAYRDLGEEAKQSAAKQRSAIDDLIADQDALRKRIEATRAQLSRVGAEPELFAIIDREFQRLLSTTRDFTLRFEDIVNDPDLMKGFETNLRNSNQIIFRELAGNQSVLRNLAVERSRELNRLNAAEDRAAQERLANLRAANSRYVVETQGSNAQLLAETRAANQQRLQAERIAGRSRIELVRFTYQQIRVLERGIAAAFRGTAAVLEGTIRTLQRGAARIGNLFRRTNADLNEGLGGALLRREQTISRSFNRQTRQITSEVTKQSAVIQRFEAQASTGIAGAVSGRSSLGALLGGGLAIGGGVGFVAGIRNQIKVGGDFVQGLAVMQAQLKLTDDEMLAVRQQSIELGNDISLPGVSALDAAEAIQILGKQFASFGAEALPAAQAAARGVLQLSRAMGVQAEEAARVVGASVNVFGAAADQATNIADQITNAMSLAAGVGFNDFADAFTQSASVVNLFIGPAQDATDALAELNAAVATLAKGGIIGSDAGTSIKQFFLQANRGTVDSVEVMNELTARAGETGTAFFDAAGDARTLAEAISILERGTRDLSDQARTQTLQKLFGSDAARAAAILIDQGAAAFRNLTESVKEQGSAARIAAAQNTGLRGALDALQSVIETQQIKTYEKYQKQLGNVVVAFAELLNAFFEGEGIFRVIRASLLGLGVALGGLLAAKAAAEAIRFLAIAMGGLVTPLGLVVGGLAVLGAAIGGLSAVSPEFRTEMGKIRDDLRGRFGEAIEFLADNLARLIGFVRTEALPPFVNFAVGVARRVLPVIEAAANQIDLLGGAFRSGLSGEGITSNGIIGFMERLGVGLRQVGIAAQAFRAALGSREFTTVLTSSGVLNEERQTAFVRFAERLGQAVGGLRSALRGEGITSRGLVGFGERVGVALRQAAVGAEAFKAAISGQEFSTVLTSAGFLNEERQTFFVRALETLGATLRAVAGQIVDIGSALRDVFTGDRTVGSILTSIGQMFSGTFTAIVGVLGPQLDAVVDFIGDFLAGAASTAAGTAGSNVQSFLTGPFQQAATAIGFFLGNLVTDPRLIEAAEKLVGLAVLTGVNFANGVFRGAASNLDELSTMFGKQLLAAVTKGLTAALRNPFTFAKIIAAGLAGAAILRAWRSAGEAGARGVATGLASGVRRNTINAGQFVSGLFGGPQALNRAAASAAFDAKARMEAEFSRINRDRQRIGLDSIILPATGLNDINLRQFRSELDQSIDNMGRTRAEAVLMRERIRESFTGIRGAATALGDSFADLARQAGGNARAAGQILGSALMGGVAAALSGQQAGSATSATGQAIGLAGVVASAIFAGLSVGGPIGVAVGGLVGVVGLLSAAWADNGEAARKAAERVNAYADVLERFETLTAASRDIAAELTDQLVEESDKTQELARRLADTGINARTLVDAFSDGTFTAAENFGLFRETLGLTDAQIRATGLRVDELIDVIKSGEAPVNATAREVEALRDVFSTLDARQIDRGAFADLFGFFQREFVALQGGIDENATRQAFDGIDAGATRARESVARAAIEVRNYRNQLGTLNVAEDLVGDARINARLQAQASNFDIIRQAIGRLNEVRTTAIQAQIDQVSSRLDAARAAADLARQQLTAYLTGDYTNTAQQALDNIVIGLPQVATGIGEAFQTGGQLGQSLLNQAFEGFDENIASILNAGFQNGITDVAGLAALLDPLRAAINELPPIVINDIDVTRQVKDQLLGQLDAAVQDQALQLGLTAIADAETDVAEAQSEFDRLQIELGARVVFDPAQIQAAAKALGLTIEINAIPTLGVGSFQLPINEPGDLVTAQRNAQAVATGVDPVTGDAVTRAVVNNTVNQYNTYNTPAAEVPVMSPADAQRANRAAATGLLAILPGTRS